MTGVPATPLQSRSLFHVLGTDAVPTPEVSRHQSDKHNGRGDTRGNRNNAEQRLVRFGEAQELRTQAFPGMRWSLPR